MRLAALILLAQSCLPSQAISLPSEETSGTWFLVFERKGETEVYVISAEKALLGLALNLADDERLIAAVHHERALDELNLEESFLEPRMGEGTECAGQIVYDERTVPRSPRAWTARYGDDFEGWGPLSSDGVPSGVRFAPYDPTECPVATACFDVDGRTLLGCNPTCDRIERPIAPRVVRPPHPPRECSGEPDCEETDFAPRLRCPPGEAHFLGTDRCRPIARSCERWPDAPGAVRATPSSIRRDAAALRGGGTIALTRGHYQLPRFVLEGKLTILGCGDETVLEGLTPIDVVRGSLEVRDARIARADSGAIIRPRAELTLRRAYFEPSKGIAILAQDESRVVLKDVAVRGSQHALVTARATLSIDRFHVEDTTSGAFVSLESTLEISRYSIVRGGYLRDGPSGGGAIGGGRVVMDRGLIEDVPNYGLLFTNGELEMNDLVIRRVRFPLDEDRRFARALLLGTATATIARIRVADAFDGILAIDGSRMSMSDVSIQALDPSGRGLYFDDTDEVTIERASIIGRMVAPIVFYTANPASRAKLSHLFVDSPGADGGIALSLGRYQLRRAEVRGAEVGLLADGSEVELQDIVVSDADRGMALKNEASAEIARARIASSGLGLDVYESADLTASLFTASGCDRAIAVEQLARVAMTDFSIEDGDVGIDLRNVSNPSDLRFDRGWVTRTKSAFLVDRCAIGAAIEGVRWDELTKPIEYGAPFLR